MLGLFLRGKRKKVGMAPGSAVYVGVERSEPARVEVFDYDADRVDELDQVTHAVAGLDRYRSDETTTWVNVVGVHDVEVVRGVAEAFELHPLVVEDILNTDQRPKLEEQGDRLLIVAKVPTIGASSEAPFEHVSIVVGPCWVVTFQEVAGDPFESVRRRLREGRGRLRRMSADYLACCLLDCIVDSYFPATDVLGERLSRLELEVMEDVGDDTRTELHRLKRELILLRRVVLPLREPLSTLRRLEAPLIHDETRPFLADVHDHCLHVVENVDALRELSASVMDLHLAGVSNRMNEIMKVLTLISTMFIPLSFLAGLYGMNFEYIPELRWRYSYFVLLGVMAVLACGMLLFFRRKRWI